MKICSINTLPKAYSLYFASGSKVISPTNVSESDVFCASKKSELTPEEEFTQLRDDFFQKWQRALADKNQAEWDFCTDSTDENRAKLDEKSKQLNLLFCNTETYKKFKALQGKIDSQVENAQLARVLGCFSINKQNEIRAEDFTYFQIEQMKDDIIQKYNNYAMVLDGKQVTRQDILRILQTERNPEVRKKAYRALTKCGDYIAEDIRSLVCMRNDYAKIMGYPNYYEYVLKEQYGLDSNELNRDAKKIYEKVKSSRRSLVLRLEKMLKEILGVKKLEAYHYGLASKTSAIGKTNEALTDTEKVVEVAQKSFSAMGWDIDALIDDGSVMFDLLPRQGKIKSNACFPIKDGENVRILANIANNFNSLKTLFHELGHAVYHLGISKDMPPYEQGVKAEMDEAIALVMESLVTNEDVLAQTVSPDVLKGLKETSKRKEISEILYVLSIMSFEREMYKNPAQDLKVLWQKIQTKYQFLSNKPQPDNKWATITHFVTHPVYQHNYIRGKMIRAQIYKALTDKLGNLTDNPNTAEFLKENIFKYGLTLTTDEILERISGKKLSVDDYVESLG